MPQPASIPQRNIAIDIFRALTMFVMIFVNDFWKIHDVPHWLEHAEWGEDFMGLSDVVFPCFLFVVGMSVPLAIERRYSRGYSVESTFGHIFSRTFALLVMGVFITNSEAGLHPEVSYRIGIYWILMVVAFILIWNRYPQGGGLQKERRYKLLQFAGVLILLYLAITFRDPDGKVFSAGWWGILGAIGWSYLLCATIYVFVRDDLKRLFLAWLIFVAICILGSKMRETYGGEALLALPRPNFYHDLLGVLHIGNGALPAFTMGGMILSLAVMRYREVSAQKRLLFTLVVVGLFVLAGAVSRHFWILAKLGATPPWVFYITAIATGMYMLLEGLVKAGKASWFKVIIPAGTATLTTYLVPYLFYSLADITGIVLPDWLTYGPMGLVNCLLFAFMTIGVTQLLVRLGIQLKI
ncbi:MAG: hypothetical protein ABS46_17730 [Cytophagaceae bacterium SCN 52-12]|nr:MAG: hypothetical protein ABS46_17730 [Cytophagaceae bacterium SCN 52-12]